ncbi:MAG: ATPase, partial [Eggerthellaceae bacterium]|nr:ATPase [Eggerthellaceae bacterium]
PLEYNRSAREFDPALLDRIKRIDVEPELSVWQDYARACGVHPAITTFLDAKPGSFYQVRAGVTGPRLVTARGWEDLSRMISAYECEGLEVDAELVGQYVQDDTISHEFFSYYQLFRKYEDDYRVASILEGQADDGLVGRAEEAPFDERVAVVGLLLDAVLERVHAQAGKAEALELAHKDLASVLGRDTDTLADALSVRMNSVRTSPDVGKRMDEAAGDHAQVKALRLEALSRVSGAVAEAPAGAQADAAKACFNTLVDEHALQKQSAMDALDNAFRFLDAAFGEQSQEALIMVTRLSADPVLVRTVAQHGSGEFLKHNKSLLLSERNVELLQQIEALDDSLQDTADHAEQEG